MARKKITNKKYNLDKDLGKLFKEHHGGLWHTLALSMNEENYDYAGIKLVNDGDILLEVNYYDGYPDAWELEKTIYKILIPNKLFVSKLITEINEEQNKILIIHTTDNPYSLMFGLDKEGSEYYEEIINELENHK